MSRRKTTLFDPDGMPSGNTWVRNDIPEERSLWDLADQDEGCPHCGFEGPLRSTRKGWKCLRCREYVIPEY